MTAFGRGLPNILLPYIQFPFTSHPFLSIRGSTGQFDVYYLSRKAMLFARIIWGRMAVRVGGRLFSFKVPRPKHF